MSEETKRALLVVEDDPGLQRQLRWAWADYDVTVLGSRAEAVEFVQLRRPAVVTLDLGLPPDPDGSSEGLATLEEILGIAPHTKVIMVTGSEEREAALKAISLGAYDFYQKPINMDVLQLIIQRAFHLFDLEEENRQLAVAGERSPLEGLITGSAPMLKVCAMVEKVAPSDVSTLLLGASGTGKELLARAIHKLSRRGKGPFVAINCAAIPENLLESELFGYERGAFTGAVKTTPGKIEMAQGGTLFLDEIGDLPLPLQSKLLRFLQERVIERVGGRKEIDVDVRVVSATHQNLNQQILDGRFREDLFYRLSEVTINIPALREREADVLLIAQSMLDRFNKDLRRSIKGFSQDGLGALSGHAWPGNVRELENRLKRAVLMAEGKYITARDLDLAHVEQGTTTLNLKDVRADADKRAIRRAWKLAEGNVSMAAKLLGITRPTFYDMVRQYGIALED